ncbi:MAG: hypothetical protein V4663_09585 [Bacteroidota bacterium]
MKFLTKPIPSIICLCFAFALLFLGCKKEELTAAQWGERAIAKHNEILALSANIPCSQKAKVSVQTIQLDCTVQFYPIISSDLAKYEKLKKEYLDFINKQYAAWNKEGLIVEPCFETLWATNQPIRLDCKDDKVYLITAENLPVDEAKVLITSTKSQLNNLTDALSCTSEVNWHYARLINHQTMSIEYIPYSSTADYKELRAKASLYNRLNLNVIKAEQKGNNFTNIKTIEKIECVNGKPVIRFKN